MKTIEHTIFSYNKRDIEPSGAIKRCVCDSCKSKREAYKKGKNDE